MRTKTADAQRARAAERYSITPKWMYSYDDGRVGIVSYGRYHYLRAPDMTKIDHTRLVLRFDYRVDFGSIFNNFLLRFTTQERAS